MAGNTHAARMQFEENLRRLGPTGHVSDPERFNLYSGLANLAEGLEALEKQLSAVQSELRRGRGLAVAPPSSL